MRPPVSLRQKHMAARRARILEAAGALVRETGGTDFTMSEVAARADVSPATTYNFFGSRNGLLYALLNRSLDHVMSDVVQFAASHALEHPVEAAETAAGIYASDPVFYRALFRVLLGVHDAEHRPRFMQRCVEFWRHALREAVAQRLLPEAERERDDLIRALLVHFAGVLELWIHDELDEAGFKAQVSYGTALQMLGFADEATRACLLARMRDAGTCLPAACAFISTAATAREAGLGSRPQTGLAPHFRSTATGKGPMP